MLAVENKERTFVEEVSYKLRNSVNIVRNNDKISSESACDEVQKFLYVKYLQETKRNSVYTYATYSEEHINYQDLFSSMKLEYSNMSVYNERNKFIMSEKTFVQLLDYLECLDFVKMSKDDKSQVLTAFYRSVFYRSVNPFNFPKEVSDFIVDLIAPKKKEKVLFPTASTNGMIFTALDRVSFGDIFAQSGSTSNEGLDDIRLYRAMKFFLMVIYRPSINFTSDDITNDQSGVKYDVIIDFPRYFFDNKRDYTYNHMLKCMSSLKENGRVIFLVPQSFLRNGALNDTRKSIEEQARIGLICDFDYPVLGNAVINTSIVVLTKRIGFNTTDNYKIPILKINKEGSTRLKDFAHKYSEYRKELNLF